MKRHLLVVALVAFGLLVGAAGAALAQSSNDGLNRWMRVNNHSYDGTAVSVYIAPARTNYWSRDLLGADIIRPGQSLNVNFDDGSRQCIFDIRVTSEARGRDWMFHDIDVCRHEAVNLR